jgi:hypothetical protein
VEANVTYATVTHQHPSVKRSDSPYVAAWLTAHDVVVSYVPSPDDRSHFYFTYPADAAPLVAQYEAGGTIEARRFAEALRQVNGRLRSLRRRIDGVAA